MLGCSAIFCPCLALELLAWSTSIAGSLLCLLTGSESTHRPTKTFRLQYNNNETVKGGSFSNGQPSTALHLMTKCDTYGATSRPPSSSYRLVTAICMPTWWPISPWFVTQSGAQVRQAHRLQSMFYISAPCTSMNRTQQGAMFAKKLWGSKEKLQITYFININEWISFNIDPSNDLMYNKRNQADKINEKEKKYL